jgi:ankyrin repeat protein
MLTSIQARHDHRDVTLVLQMLLWSDRRLTVEACNDAVIVRPEKKPAFSAHNQFFDRWDIVNICSGLVTTVWSNTGYADSQYLQLAHASVREYLSSQEIIQPFRSQLKEAYARACLLRMCHAYLGCIDWSTMGDNPDGIDQTFPLADWAASTWPEHARYLEAVDDDAPASVLGFLQRVCVLSKHFFRYSIAPFYWADRTQCYPLYFAAFTRLRRSCRQLIQSDWANTLKSSDDQFSGSAQTSVESAIQIRLDASLSAAATRGYVGIVQDLLGHGAHPDAFRFSRYTQEYTALHLASKSGHTEVVRLLIKGGASINYNAEPSCRTALYEASRSGHVDVVNVILAHKADPDIQSQGWSPLRVARFYGHVAVAQALISAGAKEDIYSLQYTAGQGDLRKGSDDPRPVNIARFGVAVSRKDESRAHSLLEHFTGLKDKGNHTRTATRRPSKRGALADTPETNDTALMLAARSGNCHAVQTLLDCGADLSDCKWHNPILAAAHQGHFEIVEQILLHGVHINESGPLGTALYQAAWNNLETLVKILLKHGAVANEREEGIRTSLQIATAKRHLGVMRLLIASGADVDRDGWPQYPSYHHPSMPSLRATADRAWLRWLQIYPGSTLKRAGDSSPIDSAELLSKALTPLQIAVMVSSIEAVGLLLDSGADVNKGQWCTPLQIAVSMGQTDIAEKLLGNGAHVNILDPDETLLDLATRHNHGTIVRLLIVHGAAVQGNIDSGNDPLQLAALHGRVRTAQVLLAAGYKRTTEAPVTQGTHDDTRRRMCSALNIAVRAGTSVHDHPGGYEHFGVVRLLLNHGCLNKSDWIPALHYVVQQGHRRYLHLFLEHGVDVNESYVYRWKTSITDASRTTSWKLLRVASFYGHEGLVRLLLHCGAEMNDNSQGNCALASAAAGRQESMMRLLIRRGANIEVALQVAWRWTNSRKITRRLRRLHASIVSPPDRFPEWEEHDSLSLLDESYPQPPAERIVLAPQQNPLLSVEEYSSDFSQSPLEGASSRRRSGFSSAVSRLRSRLSKTLTEFMHVLTDHTHL